MVVYPIVKLAIISRAMTMVPLTQTVTGQNAPKGISKRLNDMGADRGSAKLVSRQY